jgi:uncharacterized protein YydD (DUF2326 family)
MIKEIRSNNPKFKTIKFNRGFNVVLADREKAQKKDDSKDTRNGAGKSTLVEIIHFCLGASASKNSPFKVEELKDWSFSIVMDLFNKDYIFTRFVDKSSKIYIDGDADLLGLDIKYDKKQHLYYVGITKFNECMLSVMYNLEKDDKRKYTPSFRELISYNIRRGLDGYRNAFEFFSKQKVYSVQGCNAYFLGLNLDYASQFQEIKDKVKGIGDYKKAAGSGILGKKKLNIGELNTEMITLEQECAELKKQLESFKVHPQYAEITKEADQFTEQIHNIVNEVTIKKQLLGNYEKSVLSEENDMGYSDIERIYNEAGITFVGTLKKKLDEVINFHNSIIENRKKYLQNEINKINSSILEQESILENCSEKRAALFEILANHGALEEYTAMQERYALALQKLEEVREKLSLAQTIEDSKSRITIENQELLLKSRRDYIERMPSLEKAISIFRNNSEALYSEPGTLTVDLEDTGYKFGVNIKRAKSQGINYMKVMCYDLMLMELRTQKQRFPDFLIHDSTIFDGVDERQVAKSLILAMDKSVTCSYQYICLLNSDTVPEKEMTEQNLEIFNNSVVRRISDKDDESGLLGIKF